MNCLGATGHLTLSLSIEVLVPDKFMSDSGGHFRKFSSGL